MTKMNRLKMKAALVLVVVLLVSSLSLALAETTSSVVGVWKGQGVMDDLKRDITVTFADQQFVVASNKYTLQGDYTLKDNVVTLTALGFEVPMTLEATSPRTMSGTLELGDYKATITLTESLDVDPNAPAATVDPNKKSGDLNDLLQWLMAGGQDAQ